MRSPSSRASSLRSTGRRRRTISARCCRLIGQRTGNVAKLRGIGRAAFRAALQEYTEARVPLDYAMTNYNLGNSLQLAGQFKDDPALLKQAIDRLPRRAQALHTRATSPRQWALVQAYMGCDAAVAGDLRGARSRRWKAIGRGPPRALEVLTRDNAPTDWANAPRAGSACACSNLGNFGNEAGPACRRPRRRSRRRGRSSRARRCRCSGPSPRTVSATCIGRSPPAAAARPDYAEGDRALRERQDRPSPKTGYSAADHPDPRPEDRAGQGSDGEGAVGSAPFERR